MKIRNGFVSNSSTSSFTCEVCGRTETEWDSVSLSDLGFVRCVNEHMFCDEEAVADSEEVEGKYGERGLPAECCPICTFSVFSESDLKRYLKILTKIPEDEAFAQVKAMNKRRRVLRTNEYIMYACTKGNFNKDTLLAETKAKYGTYEAFKAYLWESK